MTGGGCRAQVEKGKDDKAPLLSPLQLHRAKAQPGTPPFCSSSPGLEKLIQGLLQGQPNLVLYPAAQSTPACTMGGIWDIGDL